MSDITVSPQGVGSGLPVGQINPSGPHLNYAPQVVPDLGRTIITWPSTAAEVPTCIDQWSAQVGDLLGRDSATYAELCKLYNTACRELDQPETESDLERARR